MDAVANHNLTKKSFLNVRFKLAALLMLVAGVAFAYDRMTPTIQTEINSNQYKKVATYYAVVKNHHPTHEVTRLIEDALSDKVVTNSEYKQIKIEYMNLINSESLKQTD